MIRKAREEDAEGVGEVFYKSWLATYPNEKAGITVDDIEDHFKDRAGEEHIEKLRAFIRNLPESWTALVACEGDLVIGTCRVRRWPKLNELQTIYVLPDHFRKGIGTKLWEAAKTYLDPTKDTIVDMVDYNTRAISFYEQLNFVDTGKRFTNPRFTMKSGAVLPEMRMILKTSSSHVDDSA